jgi:hypothetical protein
MRIVAWLLGLMLMTGQAWSASYPVVDTGQNACFDDSRQISCPRPGQEFNGQDSQYQGNLPRYRDNGDGTVSDLVTGLMWVKARGNPVSWQEGMDGAKGCRVGGHADWRAPSIKELYSLMDFNGWIQADEAGSTAFIDTRYFDFKWGDTKSGARIIDCQDWSSTVYVGTTMGGAKTAFGVNFADGRIKGYPVRERQRKSRYIRYVRGNPDYGKNDFHTGGDGTVIDRATGLFWQHADDGKTRNWGEALAYCENLNLGGRADWRLPSAKELQSIVEYSRSPKTSNSAALDPVFSVSDMESYFWTSTTHLDGPKPSHAVYIAFGRAMGYFSPPNSGQSKALIDVHGAGAQRSDPKSGDPGRYPQGHGPQGDDIRIFNFVRCVAGGGVAYYEPSNDRIPAWKGRSQSMGDSPNMRQGGQGQGMGQQGQRRGPPPEAFTACKGVSVGDGCTVKTPRGTLKGVCRDTPEGTACAPEGVRDGPPPVQ